MNLIQIINEALPNKVNGKRQIGPIYHVVMALAANDLRRRRQIVGYLGCKAAR